MQPWRTPAPRLLRPAAAPGAGTASTTGTTTLPGRITCARCGVATTSPWPSDEQLGAAYAVWYRPEEGRFSGLGDKILARTRSTLATRLNRVLPAGPVLDVGAGDGTLVEAFRRQGRDATGVDPYYSGTTRTFAPPSSRI